MQSNKLKLIFILILAVLLFSCSKEVKEQKPVEAKVETSVKTELPPQETQAKEEKTEKEKEVVAEDSNKEAEKEGLKYLSDEKHYMAKGSLLFYNLNINDTYEQALAKLKEFGVNGLYPTAMMPKSLQEMGCKAYIPDDKTLEERAKLNYDHPKSFETSKLIEDIKILKSGKAVDLPIYDYTMHTRSKETMRVYPKPVIIVEGILILEDARLRELMDLKVYVDTDADERLIRRILRDTKERGRSLESILTQYQNTVKPMHEEFIEPSKKHADIIIPRGGENTPAIEMLVQHLKTFLDKDEKDK